MIINQDSNQENMFSFNLANKEVDKQAFNTDKQTGKNKTTIFLKTIQQNLLLDSLHQK